MVADALPGMAGGGGGVPSHSRTMHGCLGRNGGMPSQSKYGHRHVARARVGGDEKVAGN